MLKLGEFLFKFRDYTPVPFVVYLIFFANMTLESLIVGSISVLVGEWIRVHGVAYIGGVSRTRTFSTGQKLITGGPFSKVRNPLYIGNFFLSAGCVILANAGYYFLALFIAFFIFQYIFIVNWEENNLRGIFGEEFDRYCSTVPRWFPRLTSAETDGISISGNYAKAIKSEKATIIAVVLIYLLVLWRSGWFAKALEMLQTA